MAPVRNACITYQSIPEKFIIPRETTKYTESRTIDLDNVALSGGFLAKTLVLSSDPYLRGKMRHADVQSYAVPFVVGEPIENFGIVVVLRSDDPQYQVGDYLYSIFTFEEYVICHTSKAIVPYMKVEKHSSLPWSLYVGMLGMPGQAAYMGWKALAEDKARTAETLFVTAGAGPVGSFVIQLAKFTNPKIRVIASAGTSEKVKFMQSIGADVVFNYKEKSTERVLDSEKPIDIYWDNVAGPTLDAALAHMAYGGIIVASGAMSTYNGERYFIKNYHEVFARAVKIFGFVISDFWLKYTAQFYAEVPEWLAQQKLKYLEHRYDGLNNGEQALVDVHTGQNLGKAVIIVAEE